MPIYEYLCRDCQQKFEKIRPASRAHEPVACPRCGRPTNEQMFSTFATCGSTPTGGGCGPGGRFT